MKTITSSLKTAFALIGITLLFSCQDESPKADLIITNATVWTGDEDQPAAEAIAVSGDTILFIGKNSGALAFEGKQTEIVDADSKFITPGFIDTHIHLLDGGFNLTSVQLRDAKTPQEFAQRISDFSKTVPKGTWILGGAWDGKEWGVLPSKQLIDELTPDYPVFVTRLDGHIAVANSLALKLVGIDENVQNVEGGVIGRDDSNALTGIFRDNAMNLISSKIPQPSDQQFDNAVDNAMNYLVSNGVTSAHHVWYPTDPNGIREALDRAYDSERLKVRILDLGALANWEKRASLAETFPENNRLNVKALKGVFDGALGSHTAAFMEPYTDAPQDTGLFMLPQENLYEWVSKADKLQLQVAIHAIGDRAIHVLLNNFEKIQKENGARDRRFRVEHAQHIASTDIPRFTELNVIPSMQPYHAIDDGRWAEDVIGPERIKGTYAFKSLIEAGAKVAFGSDWPVAPASPLMGIYAATTRRTLDGANPNGWVPEQKISVQQALVAYTKNGAYASFEEQIKGTLEVGKLADFVILSDNLLTIDPGEIQSIRVLQTYVGGEKVYDLNK